jgi:hypothetical protein
MGGSSRNILASEIEGRASENAGRLDKIGIGGFARIMEQLNGRFGSDWGKIPAEVARGFDKVRDDTNSSFRQAAHGSAESAAYLARTSGAPITGGEVSSIIRRDATNLDQQRRLTLGQIQMEEANAGMNANNGFMRLMTGAGQTALGMASTYQNQALSAANGASSTNPWASALSGAASGAAAGSAIPGWGTVIGGVIGGVGGYMAGR